MKTDTPTAPTVNRTSTLSVVLDDRMIDELRRRATVEDRSVSAIVRRALAIAFANNTEPNQPEAS